MIKPAEIQNKARAVGVRDQQIEKDYMLSWILQGIAQHSTLSKTIVFKGGTVLKKVYFKDYRFSEDLDFSLLDDTISNEQIFEWFTEVFEYIKEEANIPLEIIDNDEHQDGGINFYISYVDPLGGLGANKKVKVDISRSEKLVFEPVLNDAFIDYTDQEEHQLLCYSLEEVLVEKLRSVMQRMQARDFYDIWYLLEIHNMDIDFHIAEFRQKCESKDIDPTDFHTKLEQRLPQYKGRWEKSLADQIQDLPDFETVLREVMRHLKKLEL
ncbi:nucleotidyl transferase AbiEii/AbiGii toxin family protein [Subsaximicrobium wynnwilliamsii]|uniref:Nucleotidyl transferase AbiEii/AbiGii toxin family protein n=1 Tax=Subsaximicrobium wynnwilliamsii TaxID=291179 RepID=A0A5C6ZHX5_9FLAO|nr:nucleotidyl transferase AbiEii/AbiGii toxin family protein [Subsaximicrobium wynnwilliamsii]TXD82808.1 nucleotidyl transferase AbiEii/AbiGii toxin family protein [Subsaximicrobium wynnwilliamsii]TXD88532.1 nucleotidyl transferase AbiEii/AbiGii toxin family protein [Subsaximicrobium wynnwilliamsii]TXE02472.1 nucleotidyl transferase AbiEii/AbiGii toxin family protein [Subsaximicrobium wynnwilliamsii]